MSLENQHSKFDFLKNLLRTSPSPVTPPPNPLTLKKETKIPPKILNIDNPIMLRLWKGVLERRSEIYLPLFGMAENQPLKFSFLITLGATVVVVHICL